MDVSLLAGSVLLMLGTAAFILSILRAVTHVWTFGAYEIWVLPVAGVAFVVLGRALVG